MPGTHGNKVHILETGIIVAPVKLLKKERPNITRSKRFSLPNVSCPFLNTVEPLLTDTSLQRPLFSSQRTVNTLTVV